MEYCSLFVQGSILELEVGSLIERPTICSDTQIQGLVFDAHPCCIVPRGRYTGNESITEALRKQAYQFHKRDFAWSSSIVSTQRRPQTILTSCPQANAATGLVSHQQSHRLSSLNRVPSGDLATKLVPRRRNENNGCGKAH